MKKQPEKDRQLCVDTASGEQERIPNVKDGVRSGFYFFYTLT
jgi:hypothetical protein